jgi:hypothetical protein
MPAKQPTKLTGPAPTIEQYVEAFCDAPMSRAAVNQLSDLLARVVGGNLQQRLPKEEILVGHRSFGGSNRRHHLDIFVADQHLGLKLGIDVKGLNSKSSVGKNWNNRVGDLHELALNHHSHFPNAVLGGVLAIPFEGLSEYVLKGIERSMFKLQGRRAIANSANLFECASLIVISKDERRIIETIPEPGSPLRYEVFGDSIAKIYQERH